MKDVFEDPAILEFSFTTIVAIAILIIFVILTNKKLKRHVLRFEEIKSKFD